MTSILDETLALLGSCDRAAAFLEESGTRFFLLVKVPFDVFTKSLGKKDLSMSSKKANLSGKFGIMWI